MSIAVTINANASWICPVGVSSVQAELWGAGGDGSGNDATFAGSGGGGGAYQKKNSSSVTPATLYPVVASGSGASSTFNGLTANGGGNASIGVAGSGGAGVSSGYDANHSGGNGAVDTGPGGGGGGGAGSSGNGGNAVADAGGTGGAGGGGNGGNGDGANAGTAPAGGGGGGAIAGDAGAGANGRVKLTYTPSTNLIDSLPYGSNSYLLNRGFGKYSVGQSMTGDGGTIDFANFVVTRNSSSTGTIQVEIYAHSGAFGTESTVTGAVLATSDTFDISTLTNNVDTVVKFNFSGANRIALANGTHYVIVVATTGTGPNVYIKGVQVAAAHNGNYVYYNGSAWGLDANADLMFELYSAVAQTPKINRYQGILAQ